MDEIKTISDLAGKLTLVFIMGCDNETNNLINESLSKNFKLKASKEDIENFLKSNKLSTKKDWHLVELCKHKFEQNRGEYEKEERVVKSTLNYFISEK